jgi:hypothetical protein
MTDDRRLFDSSSMTPPPAPEIDAMTCTVDDVIERRKAIIESRKRMLDMFPYDGPPLTMGDSVGYTLLSEWRFHGRPA